MKTCPKCGKELKDTAKFCGGCGTKLEAAPAPAPEAVCPSCGNALRPGAKFCGKCGAKTAAAPEPAQPKAAVPASTPETPDVANVRLLGSFVQWSMLPGQLAVKIDEADIAAYGSAAKGLAIQDGVKALFFLRGKFTAELAAGSYEFKDLGAEDGRGNAVMRFFGGLARFFTGGGRDKAEAAGLFARIPSDVPPVSVVLVRAAEFPLVFEVADAATDGIRSAVAIRVLAQISNLNKFYESQLLDRKFVSFQRIADWFAPAVKGALNRSLAGVRPDAVADNLALQTAFLSAAQESISALCDCIRIERVIELSASNEEMERIRKLGEELYVSERELSQLSRRNEFLNRLQAVQNEQELAELKASGGQAVAREQTEAEIAAAKEKIYEQMAATEDERAKFDLMLGAQRKLREAKSEEETAVALHEFEKSGLLRAEELDALRDRIGRDDSLRGLSTAQAIALATLANEEELDRKRLEWEIQIGNRREENVIARRRMQDSYEDERREAERRHEREEREDQLDALRKAQAIRMEREEAEHRREMESEKLHIDAKLDEKRIYAGMTFEQIMAANPDIAPAAAQALAKKFEAEAAAAQTDKTAQMAVDQKNEMMDFMKQQMDAMRQMALAGMQSGASAQKAIADAKQAELDRLRADGNAGADRVLAGMQTTVQAVAGAFAPSKTASRSSAPRPAAKSGDSVCPSCGAAVEPGTSFCDNCGSAI